MRKLIVSTFVSLDGVMQAPGGPEEDPSGGFTHGGWTVQYWDGDDTLPDVMGNFMARPFDLLLGRRTYEIFAAFWPNASEEEGAGPLNRATKYVASRTLAPQDLPWGPSRLVTDVPAQVAELKRGVGPEIQVHGSGNLIQTLLRHDLVDELQLLVFPVVLGTGKRLFGDGTRPRALRLVGSRTSSNGVVVANYRPAGPVETGTFAKS